MSLKLHRQQLTELIDSELSGDFAALKERSHTQFSAKRKDGLFSKLLVQQEICDGESLGAFQLCVHYFESCPIPSGPFGIDGVLQDLVEDQAMGMLYSRRVSGDWLRIGHETNLDADWLCESLIPLIGPTLDAMASDLMKDELVSFAAGMTDEPGEQTADEIKGVLQSSKFGNDPRVAKIGNQVWAIRQGRDDWASY